MIETVFLIFVGIIVITIAAGNVLTNDHRPSRFHQALYADNIRKRIASGEITEEQGIKEFMIIMGYYDSPRKRKVY